MEKFSKIWRWCLWGLLGLGLSWLIACNPASVPNNGEELEFWTMQLQPQFTPYFTELISKFEAENPEIKIRWVDVPWEAMESKILTAVSAKTPPDVVNLNPNFASQLAARNAWLPLDEKVSPTDRETYLPKIWQASTLDGESFGIPWYLTTRISLYNQQLFTEAGIEQPPKTYAELADVAAKIQEKTGKYAFFATFIPGDSGEVLESLVQMGVQLLDNQGKAAFNTPEAIAAFQYWVDLYQNELLPPEVLTQGHRYGIELYQSGELALLASGAEFLKTIQTNAPSIAQVSAAAPQITGKTGKKNVAVMNLVIPRDTDKPEAAVKFALFVTNTNNQLAFAQAANVLPSTVAGVTQYLEALEASQESDSLQQARIISARQLEDTQVLIPAMKDLNRLQKAIYENLQAAMSGEKTAEQAVADAAEAWDNLSPI